MMRLLKKIFLVIILSVILAVLYFLWMFPSAKDTHFGLNFSLTKAQYLGFDWEKMYVEILDELEPQKLRVMGLWEVVEPERDSFDFRDIDKIVRIAEQRGVKLILTLGYKQPGWPECHQPGWAMDLEPRIKDEELLEFIKAVVERYKTSSAISAWQVENEPFFVFGPECPPVPGDLLAREVALVKKLDNRPIILTDSGEKGTWLWAGRYGADILGTTMYREAYHDKYQRYITYPIPPVFYRLKAGILKALYPRIQSVIGVELQGEPWFISTVFETPWSQQKKLMDGQRLADNADYARRSGIAEHYFWGVEWWYWAKEKQNDDELWETAKIIFSSQ